MSVRTTGFLIAVLLGFINNSYILATPAPDNIRTLYNEIVFSGEKPSFQAFETATKGYFRLKAKGLLDNPRYMTVIDFSLSSTKKRLWVIDMSAKNITHHTLVAHGKNTGDEFARTFSNTPNTNMSSLGFYVTGNVYTGKHGLSLYLNGVEKGVNDNALQRAIVMHSAAYATQDFVRKIGRLGRSFGCPAIPPGVHKEIINLIKGGAALFIYYPDKRYLSSSTFLI